MPKRTFIAVLLLAGWNLCPAQEDVVVIEDRFQVEADELQVDLNVDGGEVRISRGEDAETIEVYLEYSREKCKSEVRFHEDKSRLEIEVDLRNFKFWHSKGDDSSVHALIELKLPYRPALDLDIGVKAGEVDMALGDLSIRSFELSNWAGEVDVDFDRPNRRLMETFDVNHRVGECNLNSLGNARFEQGDINGGIGELAVDFGGSGIERCMARIDLDIGETTIVVPHDVGTKLRVSKFLFLSSVAYPDWFEKDGRYYYSKNYDDVDRSLYLMISTGIGELGIEVN